MVLIVSPPCTWEGGNAVSGGLKPSLVATKRHLILPMHRAYRVASEEKSGLLCRFETYVPLIARHTLREEWHYAFLALKGFVQRLRNLFRRRWYKYLWPKECHMRRHRSARAAGGMGRKRHAKAPFSCALLLPTATRVELATCSR